ncbi:GDSL-type esterase/lipase family protein [Lactiplantibacillus plantarum]|uniref:GDSL-type esterase/lipase family protein n=3 Tax=Lactiplantibacillus plantarum TaxID=1590 RepID=UPI0039659E18
MANAPLIIDLLHPVDEVMQFPTIGRVKDQNVDVPLWIKKGDVPYDLTGHTLGFYGRDAQGIAKIAVEDPTGPAIEAGRVTFTMPAALFRAAGEYQESWFRIEKDGQLVSSLNIKFNVLQNNVEFGVDDQPYFSDYEKLLASFTGKINNDTNALEKEVHDFLDHITKMDEETVAQITTISRSLGQIQAQIDAGNVITRAQFNQLIADTDSKLQRYFDNLSDGSPKFIDSLTALKATYPNGTVGIWVATDDGHRYAYFNGAWQDGGVYQSSGLGYYPNVGIVSAGTLTIDLLNKHADLRADTMIERVGSAEVKVPANVGIDLTNLGSIDYLVYNIPANTLMEMKTIDNLKSTQIVLNAIADQQLVYPYNRHTTKLFNSGEMMAPSNRAAVVGSAVYIDWDQSAILVPETTLIETADGQFYTVKTDTGTKLDFSDYHTKGVDFMLIYDTLAKKYVLKESADQDYVTTNQGLYNSELVLGILNAAGLKFAEYGSNIVVKPFGESKQGNATILNGTLTIDTNAHTIAFSDDFILGLTQAGRFQSLSHADNLTYQDAATGSAINTLYYHITLTERHFYVDVYPHDVDDFRILTFWNGKAFGIDDLDRVIVNGIGDGGRAVSVNTINLQQLSTMMYSKDHPNVKIANLGDSTYQITGTDSTDGRWSDLLQPALIAETGNPNITVVNGGFSGKSIQWIHDNFDTYFGAGKQFDGVQFVILGMGLNNATEFYNLDTIKGITKDVIQKIQALGMSVVVATTQANNLTTLSDRQEWYMYAAENAMRKELAREMGLQLLDLNDATQKFLQHSQVKNSDITFDGLHFAPRGHQFEADWFESQILTRPITITDSFQVDSTVQNTKSSAPQDWVVDNPNFTDGFKTKFSTSNNTADTMLLDTLIMNMNTKPKALTAYTGPQGNGAYALINGTKHPLGTGKTVLLDYAEMGLYHIQIMSGTNGSVDVEGLKFE